MTRTLQVLAPYFWDSWIVTGAGNANFYYALTLAYGAGVSVHICVSVCLCACVPVRLCACVSVYRQRGCTKEQDLLRLHARLRHNHALAL